MNERDQLAERFETHRGHLRAVAYRMLGSTADAEDAVQEAWLRYARADTTAIENLRGWLTTVVSRVCLDMLRSRASKREEPFGPDEHHSEPGGGVEPEQEALLIDSVGRALLVVLDRLGAYERVAFVLHDMFAVPFDEIAQIVGRSPVTTKKLASRARGKVQGAPAVGGAELSRHRQLIDAFLSASRAGDVDAILAVLAPDVVRRADAAALPAGRALEARGVRRVAEEIAVFGANARFAAPALLDGQVGVVVAPRGRMRLALTFDIELDKILGYALVADPARLERLDIAVGADAMKRVTPPA